MQGIRKDTSFFMLFYHKRRVPLVILMTKSNGDT